MQEPFEASFSTLNFYAMSVSEAASVPLVCYTAAFIVVTQLRDDTENGCVAD